MHLQNRARDPVDSFFLVLLINEVASTPMRCMQFHEIAKLKHISFTQTIAVRYVTLLQFSAYKLIAKHYIVATLAKQIIYKICKACFVREILTMIVGWIS